MKKLTFKSGATDLTILIVFGFAKFYFFVFAFIIIMGIFSCGEAALDVYANQVKLFILFVLYFIIEIVVFKKAMYNRTNILKYGGALIILTTAYPLATVGYDLISQPHYSQNFNTETWTKKKKKPLAMIREILTDQKYIGLSKMELESILGKGEDYIEDYIEDSVTNIYYDTDYSGTTLIFKLTNNKVSEYFLTCF